MPFRIPSFEEARELLIASASGRFPNSNLNQRGGFFKFLSVFALGKTDADHNTFQAQQDLMPDTAEGVFLDRWREIYGVPKKGAVGASGDSAYRVFGDVAAVVPSGEALLHAPSGLLFETRSGGIIPAAGFLDVDIAADPSTGSVTNLEVNEELQFNVTPADLEDNGRIVVELVNGRDEELEDSERRRLLDRIGEPAAGGKRKDYEEFLLASADFVATGYVYPNRNGIGTVDLAALKLGTGTARLLDLSERTTVGDFVATERPVSAVTRILEVVTLATDVEVIFLIENDPLLSFDFTDSPVPTFAAYDIPTRVVTLQAARPGDMGVGDRVIFDSVGSGGQQLVIEAIDGGDPLKFTLEEDLPFAPLVADKIYSGGPVTKNVRDAVIALFDELGPANPDATSFGPWEGNLRISKLFETVQTIDGVLDSTILNPLANVEATDFQFPDDGKVELLIPGKILIRRDNT